MPTINLNALAVRAALGAGAAAAENHLALIAQEHGDQQLMEVIQQLTPAEIAVLSAEGDMTKPSIVHAFLTPGQFTLAFSRIGSRWSETEALAGYDDLGEYQRDLADFLCPIILGADFQKRRAALLGSILELPHMAETLLFLSLGQLTAEDFFRNPLTYPVDRGTWQELLQASVEHQSDLGETFNKLRTDIHQGSTDPLEIATQELQFALDTIMEIRGLAHEAEIGDAPVTEEMIEEFIEI